LHRAGKNSTPHGSPDHRVRFLLPPRPPFFPFYYLRRRHLVSAFSLRLTPRRPSFWLIGFYSSTPSFYLSPARTPFFRSYQPMFTFLYRRMTPAPPSPAGLAPETGVVSSRGCPCSLSAPVCPKQVVFSTCRLILFENDHSWGPSVSSL